MTDQTKPDLTPIDGAAALVFPLVLRVLANHANRDEYTPDESRARAVVEALAAAGRLMARGTMAVNLPASGERSVYDKPGMSYTRFGDVRAYSNGRLHIAGFGWIDPPQARELAVSLLAGVEDIATRAELSPAVLGPGSSEL